MFGFFWGKLPWHRKPRGFFILRAVPPDPEPTDPTDPDPEPEAAAMAVAAPSEERDPGDEWQAGVPARPLQAVRVRNGDRAWNDEDVQAIAGSRRFQVLMGGRGDGGMEKRA
jgi:hypothetical protein